MSDEYFKVLDEGTDYQIRLSINTFNDTEYIHLRKYYQDFSEEWLPTREGYHMPLTIEATRNMLHALLEILAKAESKDILKEHFWDILHEFFTEESK